MFHDLGVDLLIESAEVDEDCVHLLELIDYEVALPDHGLDGDATSHEHLVDCDEFSQLLVVDHVLETLDFVLQTDHH